MSRRLRRRSTELVSPAVDALRQIDEWHAEHAAAAVVRPNGVVARHGPADHVFRWASVTKLATALRDARGGRGGRGRPGRAGGAARLDRAASARPRERAAVRRRPADRASGRAPHLLQPGIRGARRARRDANGDPVSGVPRRRRLPAARNGVGAPRLRRRGCSRLARRPRALRRRAAEADARRARDARRGDIRPVPRPEGRSPRRRPLRSPRLGPGLRAQGREARSLDRHAAPRRGRSATSAARARSSGSIQSARSRSRA